MARHVSPKKPTVQRALAVLATAGVALGAGAGAASAAAGTGSVLDVIHTSPGTTDTRAGLQAASDTLAYATGTATGLKPNPLAGTGVDPLDNGVGTEVADFKPVDSKEVTGPVAQAPSVGDALVLSQVTRLVSG